MNSVLGEREFQGADGSSYRVRMTRCHPSSGCYVPGMRFLSFVDGEGRVLGVAGINPAAAVMEFGAEQLQRLLERAGRCGSLASQGRAVAGTA